MSDKQLTMGVVGTSFKENEHRAPIHPDHLDGIDEALRRRMWFERGYGVRFGLADSELEPKVAGLCSREELFAKCDMMLLPKPTEQDFPFFREGQILCGWPHCVQGDAITQLAIDKKLTLLAWEAMHLWNGDAWDLHVFHLNNELAGYCSVMHALTLKGITGHYGRVRKACVISFGSTGRGAIHALQGLGFGDVTLFTQRPGHTVAAPIPSLKHWQFRRAAPGSQDAVVLLPDEKMPMSKAIGHFDVCVNCILQDTDEPLNFVKNSEIGDLRKGTLIVDVSCDLKMGFEFARPTSFEEPTFTVGDGRALYYGVDHTPSYLWDAASYEISVAIVPLLPELLAGPQAWRANATLARSIEVQDGVIANRKILSFQGRKSEYPHAKHKTPEHS